jgi:hypothetical protein
LSTERRRKHETLSPTGFMAFASFRDDFICIILHQCIVGSAWQQKGKIPIWRCPKMRGTPIAGWLIMENPIKNG